MVTVSFQNIGFKQGIVLNTGQRNTVVLENMNIVL